MSAMRDLDRIGLGTVGAGDDQLRRRLLAVGHHRGEHRGLVVADAGHRHVQQRVEQLALALLELAGDHHPDLRIADALPGLGQPLGQIAAVVEPRRSCSVWSISSTMTLTLRGSFGCVMVSLLLAAVASTVGVPTGGDLRSVPASCAIAVVPVGQNRSASTSTWVSMCWCTGCRCDRVVVVAVMHRVVGVAGCSTSCRRGSRRRHRRCRRRGCRRW